MITEGRDFYEKRIEHALSMMATKLQSENACGKTAYNKTAETIMCGLLNRVYGYQFENANTDGRPNFPGIDLISKNKRTGVQITTQNTLKKLDDTLKKVQESKECSSIDWLIHLILTFDSPTPAMKKRKLDSMFNGTEDIWTLRTITNILLSPTVKVDELQEIVEYLEAEIGGHEALPKPDFVDEETESTDREVPVPERKTPQDPQVQKKPVSRAVRYHYAMLAATILCIVIAIWSISTALPKYKVSSPESRELMQWESVEDILCGGNLEKTTVPLSVYNSALNDGGHWNSNKIYSVSYPFAVQCSQLPVNPIAAFFSIRKEFYDQYVTSFYINLRDVGIETEYYERWRTYFSRMPDTLEKEWEWSESGVNEFLSNVLVLASKFDDGFDLDDQLLSRIHSREETVVHFSSKEQCYYVYFIYYGDCTSHLVCMYVRPDRESGTRIAEVEFQFLNMDYTIKGGMGFSLAERMLTNTIREQMMSIIAGTEYLLTGTSGLEDAILDWNAFDEEFVVPSEYWSGDYRVTIQHNSYYADTRYDEELSAESCELLTYRICSTVS